MSEGTAHLKTPYGGWQEHDPDQADSREEKRWMMKENMKGVKQLKKKDNQRIITLVERAKAKDPRLSKFLAAEKEAKRVAKEAKHFEKHKAENDKLAVEKAEADAKAAAEDSIKAATKSAKEDKERLKKAIRRIRNYLKRLVALSQEGSEVKSSTNI
jgi:DnaJ family protein C protein 2